MFQRLMLPHICSSQTQQNTVLQNTVLQNTVTVNPVEQIFFVLFDFDVFCCQIAYITHLNIHYLVVM